MKSTLSYSASLLLAGLSLTSALPAPQRSGASDVTVQILTGDGDAATTLSAGIGSTTLTQGINTRSGLSSLFQNNVWCGGFKDAGATNLWLNFDGTDGIFHSGVDARYSELCQSGFCSQGAATVAVASYWCADSLQAVQNRIQQRTLPPNGRAGAQPPAPPAPVNNNGGAAAGNGQTARLTLELEPQTTFIQREIPVDGQLTPTDLTLVSMSFVNVINGVSCQAFNGQNPVGNAASGNTPAILGAQPVQITAIQCSSAGGAAPAPTPTPAPVNNGAAGTGGAAAPPSGVSVNVQVETERQTTFFGETIQVNGQPQQLRNSAAISLTLTSAEGANLNAIQCVVIGQNGQVLAPLTGIDAAVLTNGNQAVAFSAIQCDL